MAPTRRPRPGARPPATSTPPPTGCRRSPPSRPGTARSTSGPTARASGGCGTTPRTPRGDRSPLSSVRRPSPVAIGPAASTFLGLVAASLPDTAEVVVAEEDFTALLFPFLAQASRGVTVRPVPLDGAGRRRHGPDDVGGVERRAVVRRPHRRHRRRARRRGGGRCADRRRRHPGAAVAAGPARPDRRHRVLGLQVAVLPAGHGLHGGLARAPVDVPAERGQLVRGTGRLRRVLRPAAAPGRRRPPPGPVAGLARMGGRDGFARRAGTDRHRCDPRPRRAAGRRASARGSASRPTGSAIVSIAGLGAGIEDRLSACGIKAAARADGCRLSFHIYNDDDDVEAACAALERVAP